MVSDGLEAVAETCTKWFAATSEVRGLRDADAYWIARRAALSPAALSLVCRARARLRMLAYRSCWPEAEPVMVQHKHLQVATEASRQAVEATPRCSVALLTHLEVLQLAADVALVDNPHGDTSTSLVPKDQAMASWSYTAHTWAALHDTAVRALQVFDKAEAAAGAETEDSLAEWLNCFRPPGVLLPGEDAGKVRDGGMLKFHCWWQKTMAHNVLEIREARLEEARHAKGRLQAMKAGATGGHLRHAAGAEPGGGVDADKEARAAKAAEELLCQLEAEKAVGKGAAPGAARKAKGKQKHKAKQHQGQQQGQQQQQPDADEDEGGEVAATKGGDATAAVKAAAKASAAQAEAPRESEDAASAAEPWVEATAARRQRKQQQQQPQIAQASRGPPMGAPHGHARDGPQAAPPKAPPKAPQAAPKAARVVAPALPEAGVTSPDWPALVPEPKKSAAPVAAKCPQPPPTPPTPPPAPAVPTPQPAPPPVPPVLAAAAPKPASRAPPPIVFGSFDGLALGGATPPPPPPPVPAVAVGMPPVMRMAPAHAFSPTLAAAAHFAAVLSAPQQWGMSQPQQQQQPLPVPVMPAMPAAPQLVTPLSPPVATAAPAAAAPATPLAAVASGQPSKAADQEVIWF